MANFCVLLVAALAVSALADPLRYKRQSSQLIGITGAASAQGQGWANDAHQAAALAVGLPAGGNGWGQESAGVPATISLNNQGASEVAAAANDLQVTSNDGENLAALQNLNVDQVVGGNDSLGAEIHGVEAALASSSNAAAAGSGSSAAAGESSINASGSSNLGLGKPQN